MRALDTAHALLALLHPGFHASEWTGQEVGIAIGRHILVLAVRCGEEPRGFLRQVQALNGKEKSPISLAREVFLLLSQDSKTRVPMVEALVHGFETSASTSEAKDNMVLLEELSFWEPQTLHRLREAVQRNRFVAEAWRVPERVEELIRRRSAA